MNARVKPLPLFAVVVLCFTVSLPAQTHEVSHVIQSPIQLVDFDGDEMNDGIFGSFALASSNGPAFGWALGISSQGVLWMVYRQSAELDVQEDAFRLTGPARFFSFAGGSSGDTELVVFVRPSLEIDECLIWDLTSDPGSGSTSFSAEGSIFNFAS